jgi:acyl-CoA thioesterase-1
VNPVVLQIASGNAFFIGMGLTVIAFALRLWLNGRIWASLLTVGWLVGISLVILSATPMSFWLYGLWFALCVAVRVTFIVRASFQTKASTIIAFAALSLSLCLTELPYRLVQRVTVFTNQPVFVLGDSISAGIGAKERAWPAGLGDLSHLKVINLARPGASVETALDQAGHITTTNALVIVEIGGNDLLGHTDSHVFYGQLDKLLGRLKKGNHRIVMFELPLLPLWNAFGRDQRVLAEKYRVTLIPKCYLAGVFGSKGTTVDGLHLSQKGHNALARIVYRLLRIEKPVEM